MHCLVLVIVLCFGLAAACESGAENGSDGPPRMAASSVDGAEPEATLVFVLNGIAEILERHRDEPATGLDALRTFVDEHRSSLTVAVQAIDERAEDLSVAGRTEYVDRHEGEARAAMERFARAQQAFRERATEAQRVELSEILNVLR